MPIFVRRFISKVFAGKQGSATTLINSNRVSTDQFNREKILTNISGKLSNQGIKILTVTITRILKSCFFIAVVAIAFRGSLKSDFSTAIFIRDRKALEYKKERLNTLI
ncbi:unnamed protein product [Fusarium fujikuroi]|nr:unnamed protein product [Fusarium fujikuroi]